MAPVPYSWRPNCPIFVEYIQCRMSAIMRHKMGYGNRTVGGDGISSLLGSRLTSIRKGASVLWHIGCLRLINWPSTAGTPVTAQAETSSTAICCFRWSSTLEPVSKCETRSNMQNSKQMALHDLGRSVRLFGRWLPGYPRFLS